MLDLGWDDILDGLLNKYWPDMTETERNIVKQCDNARKRDPSWVPSMRRMHRLHRMWADHALKKKHRRPKGPKSLKFRKRQQWRPGKDHGSQRYD